MSSYLTWPPGEPEGGLLPAYLIVHLCAHFQQITQERKNPTLYQSAFQTLLIFPSLFVAMQEIKQRPDGN